MNAWTITTHIKRADKFFWWNSSLAICSIFGSSHVGLLIQKIKESGSGFQVFFCVLFVAKIKPNARLVDKPTSHDRVLTCIQEWPSCAHLEYFESWLKLKTFTAQKLKDKGVSWHRQCSSGVRTPSVGSYIAFAHRFSRQRETARGLYKNAYASKRMVRERVGWT